MLTICLTFSRYSSRLGDLVFVSADCDHCGRPGPSGLLLVVGVAALGVCLSGADHQKEVPGRLCSYGVDEAAIWSCCRVVPLGFDVRQDLVTEGV